MGGRTWTDEEIGIALDLPAKEASLLTGRSVSAIEHIRKRVRDGDPKLGQPAGINAFPHVVGSRLLLAKSCGTCGWLLDAKFFGRSRNLWRTSCSWCRTKQVLERRKVVPQKRQSKVRSINEGYPHPAPRSGYLWTSQDHITASDPTLTVWEKAKKLGRTPRAIESACSKNDYRSFPRGRLGGKEDGQWQIKYNGAA